jgi:hypothetical protein
MWTLVVAVDIIVLCWQLILRVNVKSVQPEVKYARSKHNFYLSDVTIYMFRLIYSYPAGRENKNEREVFTAAWEIWDLEPLPMCYHMKYVLTVQPKE